MLNHDFINSFLLNDAAYSPSHGAINGYLGTGILYYGLVYSLKAKTAVCLGSGDGFVPRLLRQAQRDAQIEGAHTFLVDANLPEVGWGTPDYFNRPQSVFRSSYPEITIINETTKEAVRHFQSIDYIHIDADHSYQHVREDFDLYAPLLSPLSAMTLHDTNEVWSVGAGVGQLVRELRDDPHYDVCNFNDLWHGVAIVRRRK